MSGRSTQPYRRTAPRMPGTALTNMLRGRSVTGHNPADATRASFLMKAANSGSKRPKRPARAPRPKR